MIDTSYNVKLDAFEGPLDLLLHLIKKNKVDIYNIPIAKITEEYIQTLEDMKEMNLEIAGEFLIMASTLVYIKSRMLLPIYKEDNSDNLEEDPREELINLLSEYQKYQETGKKLGELPILGRDTFKKVNEKAPKQDRPLHSTELFQLINSYQNVINKYKDQFSTYDLSTPSKSLQEKLIEIITKYPEGFSSQALENLLTPPITKNEIVVSFLAILELTKRGFLKIMQPIESGDILISTIKPLNDLDMNLIQNELFTEELYGKR